MNWAVPPRTCLNNERSRARACRGFLNVSKVALDKVVQSIFEDQGTADVLRALYKGPDWCGGVTTHSVLLTLADYLSDLESWLDPPFYRRACQVRPPRVCVCAAVGWRRRAWCCRRSTRQLARRAQGATWAGCRRVMSCGAARLCVK